MSWYATKKASKLPVMDKKRILVFDTETTGLSPTVDEILQITILDGYGNELFSSYIRPVRHKAWPIAEKVNGISYSMVKDKPTFAEVKKEIQEIFNAAELVVGYNVKFDIDFVQAAGIVVGGKKFDVMTAFASYRAGIERSFYRKCKLTECAEYFGYSFNPHDAKEDAKATLRCFNDMIADERFITYKPKEKQKLKEEKPIVKKKTKVTISFNRGGYHTFIRWLILTIGGILALSVISGIVPKDIETIKRLLLFVRNNFFSNPILMVATIVTLIGCLNILIRLLRKIIMLPKWIIIHVQRLIKRS